MRILTILPYFLVFVFFSYPITLYFFTRVPIVLTNKKYFPVIFKEVPIPKNSVVYELGCGKADFLFFAEKYEPKKLIGFELSPIHVIFANFKAKLLGSKVKVYRKNFFKADISEADYIYLFLVKKVSNKTWLKISKEAKKGAIILSLSDSILNEQPYKVFKTQPNNKNSTFVYVYQIK